MKAPSKPGDTRRSDVSRQISFATNIKEGERLSIRGAPYEDTAPDVGFLHL
jgi:hypothetical protein